MTASRFRIVVAFLSALLTIAVAPRAFAQGSNAVPVEPAPGNDKVDVAPQARDEEIQARLASILTATEWFDGLAIRVQDGVVFLSGMADNDEHRKWAGDLARRTQAVAAVVNRLEVRPRSISNFAPAIEGLHDLGNSIVGALPFLVFALFVLAVAWVVSRIATALARRALSKRTVAPLLREVIAKVVGGIVMTIGLYVVFRIAGLTAVALSVVGGTGLLGLILGIAFRDITENFLASVFLSLQPPVQAGDLLSINEHVGYVERLTNRVTVLMSLEGNHIQIPNSTVYRATICNYTSSATRRIDFTVGIGYDDAISEAQTVAMSVLTAHPAVLAEPEPWVLVESLGAATVNLRLYFWLDGTEHSWLKVKSSVIRLVKRAFQGANISMPDEARELVFPDGVPVRMVGAEVEAESPPPAPMRSPSRGAPSTETGEVTTTAEGGLSSEAGELREQARKSRTPEGGENLLAPAPKKSA
jgi:small conductance mechanosensitive channel